MSTITTRDGTEIYYKDWGSGQPVVFGHGWPLDGDMWEYQMNFLAERGYRVIAYDRRGFGRSSQPWSGYDYDTFADDLAELMDKLDLQGAALVGFSMGGGDVARYIGRHGSKRVAKAALLGAVTPIFGQAPDFPQGVPAEVFAGIKEGLLKDRAQFISDFAAVFFGTNRPGKADAVSAGVLSQTFNIAMLASLKGTLDCVSAFSGTDFREDIKKFNFPTLVIHGDDDQVVPFQTTGKLVAEMVPGAQLKIYGGAPHALCATHKDQINEDLLALLKG